MRRWGLPTPATQTKLDKVRIWGIFGRWRNRVERLPAARYAIDAYQAIALYTP
ncbi:MAG: hypothetical protein U7127_02970 [Phormidium sp.]